MTEQEADARPSGRWDPLIHELHHLREAAGTPSYDAMTRKLIEQRIGDGQTEHAARIAKSSVHFAFTYGRSRINESLVRELVRVLGGDPADVDAWMLACLTPRQSEDDADPSPAPSMDAEEEEGARATFNQQVVLMLACLALNLLGREFVDYFRLPVYLDMVGTAVAAIALGPWRGAAVGASTNIIGAIGSGWVSLPFALVNITGALVWGYGVRRWGMGRTLPRFLSLNVLAAVACSLVAVPIIALILDGGLRNGHDAITQLVSESIEVFPIALGFSNLLTSLSDKLVSGFVALVLVSALPLAFRRGANLVGVDGDHRD